MCVINDPLGQAPKSHQQCPLFSRDACFVLRYFEMRGRTDNMSEYNDHYRPGLWVGLSLLCAWTH